ncbi:sigma 54-interacting transcriptional regulator [Neobacillus niacini]|uniref:sigma 54-interacting transcriptional regulator n=1 Tax=Neobacillus niacini TaxID=86668 RepID=UPI003B02DE7F
MDLLTIQPVVQQIADAIASVLKIEVEIANHQFIRVAGTGEQKNGVLTKMEGDLVYRSAIRTGRPVIIGNPGFEEICKRCQLYQDCPETGEICTPIFYNDISLGVIGLLAFNQEQKQRLFENSEGILEFLNKMSDLLASKLHEHEVMERLKDSSNKLTRMMDLVEQGIVVMDNFGQIHEMNAKAKMLLGLSESTFPAAIKEQLKELVQHHQGKGKTVQLAINGEEKSFFIVRQELSKYGNQVEHLFMIQAVDEIQHLAERTAEDRKKAFNPIIGNSLSMKEIKEYAFRVSQSNSTILIQGESGTGKEEFARAIHLSSPRKQRSFITVNCGAIPEHLLESELFGYEKGAFTGANPSGKPGKFEMAHQGTIFLDEIGEMPLHLQVKLLRVLQQKEVERIGGVKTIPLDVRVIAATNQDLQHMVNEGRFREDLYFRLNVIPIFIPPLRNRKEDIVDLSYYFIRIFNESFGAKILGLDSDVMEFMQRHVWKGNVRELRNFIEYLFNFFTNGWITMEDAGPMIQKKLNIAEEKGPSPFYSIDEMEKQLIEKALLYIKQNHGKIEDASTLLGIGRATLFRKMKKYQIDTQYQSDTSS